MKNQKSQNKEILGLLPVGIVNSKNFTRKCKYLIATLLYLNGLDKVKEDGYFFRTNLTLAEESNMAEKNLLINLRKLELMNFLVRKAGKRKEASEYRINVDSIFNYVDTKVSNDSIKVSNDSIKVSNKLNVSDELNASNQSIENKSLTTNTANKVSNTKVSDTFINVSTDTDTEKESDKDKEKNNKYINNDLEYYIKLYIKDFLEKIKEIEKRIETNNSVLNDKLDMILFSIINNNNRKNTEANNTPMKINNNQEASANATASNLNSEKIVSSLTSIEEKGENTSTQEKIEKNSNTSTEKENIEANNTHTSTQTSFSSAGLNDNVNCEQVPTQDEKVQENAGKEAKIVNNAKGLVDRLSQVTSISELNHKAQLYVNWLDANANSISNATYTALSKLIENKYEELFDKLANSTPTTIPTQAQASFSSAGLNDNVNCEQAPIQEGKAQENAGKEAIEDNKEDDFFSSIFSTPSKITAIVAKENKAESKMVKVIATGELISVMDVVRKGLGVDDVCDANSSATENSSNQPADNEEEIHYSSSVTKENSSETKEDKVESKPVMVKVIATGEIVSVMDVVRRGLGIDDVVDIKVSNEEDAKVSNQLTDNKEDNTKVSNTKVSDKSSKVSDKKDSKVNNKRRKVTPPAGGYLVQVGGKNIRLDEFYFTLVDDFMASFSA